MTCHPVLSTDARVALTLRLFGGLTTEEIARAFLVPEATVQQRVVRAKRTLAEARVPFEIPRGDELSARLPAVLEVIYLVFNEGYSATAGDDWVRPALCEDALRMGRVLAGLVPREPEVHGLGALMELQVGVDFGPDHVHLPPAVADHQALEAQLPRKNRVQRQGCRRARKNADDSDVTADAGRHQRLRQ